MAKITRLLGVIGVAILVGSCGGGGSHKNNNDNGGVVTLNAPYGLTATAVSSYRINLAWVDNSANEVQFHVERRRVANAAPVLVGAEPGFIQIATVNAGVTTYQDSGCSASTKYEYRVRAFNNSLYSGYSNVAAVKTGACDGTGGPLQGTWHMISKWDNGQKSNVAMLHTCQNNNDLIISFDCARKYHVASATIKDSVLNVIFATPEQQTWVGTINGGTISGPDTDEEYGPGTTYWLKKSSGDICPSGQFSINGTVDGALVSESSNDSYGFSENIGPILAFLLPEGPESAIAFNDFYPPTGVKVYEVTSTGQMPGTVTASFLPPDDEDDVPADSGNITITHYVPPYSGESSGIKGTFALTLENGRGQVSGSFDLPFFLQFTDPFINIP